jgi:hypothetical protein
MVEGELDLVWSYRIEDAIAPTLLPIAVWRYGVKYEEDA